MALITPVFQYGLSGRKSNISFGLICETLRNNRQWLQTGMAQLVRYLSFDGSFSTWFILRITILLRGCVGLKHVSKVVEAFFRKNSASSQRPRRYQQHPMLFQIDAVSG